MALLEVAINWFANILFFLIFMRAILSWFPPPQSDGPLKQLYQSLAGAAHFMTEPIIVPIRNLIHNSPLGGSGMGLDFAPLIAIVLISVVRNILVTLVRGIF
ncbi:MAG: YggT family protein [Defluviitaleaceae bacterium]|nr:YggT family protein [Defluviitaleaceae bacterium]